MEQVNTLAAKASIEIETCAAKDVVVTIAQLDTDEGKLLLKNNKPSPDEGLHDAHQSSGLQPIAVYVDEVTNTRRKVTAANNTDCPLDPLHGRAVVSSIRLRATTCTRILWRSMCRAERCLADIRSSTTDVFEVVLS